MSVCMTALRRVVWKLGASSSSLHTLVDEVTRARSIRDFFLNAFHSWKVLQKSDNPLFQASVEIGDCSVSYSTTDGTGLNSFSAHVLDRR